MARGERDRLGHNHCLRRLDPELRRPPHSTRLPRRLRSRHVALAHADQQPVVHAIRASVPVRSLVRRLRHRSGPRRPDLLRLPARRTGSARELADHVHRAWRADGGYRVRGDPADPQLAHASWLLDGLRKGGSVDAYQREQDGRGEPAVQIVAGGGAIARSADLVIVDNPHPGTPPFFSFQSRY